MKPLQKTNALRILDSMGIPYETAMYDPGDEHVDAAVVARMIGEDPDRVFKTLVARDERNNVVVFCLPGSLDLDPGKAAKAAGAKKISLIHLRELFALTGYVRGGCSPVGMKKKYPVIIDESARLYETLFVNAGARGILMLIACADLGRVCDATFADISA